MVTKDSKRIVLAFRGGTRHFTGTLVSDSLFNYLGETSTDWMTDKFVLLEKGVKVVLEND